MREGGARGGGSEEGRGRLREREREDVRERNREGGRETLFRGRQTEWGEGEGGRKGDSERLD